MDPRPDLLAIGGEALSPVERSQIRWIRETFTPGPLDRTLRWCQRTIGSRWITLSTNRLRHAHHFDRWPVMDPAESYVCVSNHRSFFDLYIITGHLVRAGVLPHRIVFPVRSEFFYDRRLGFFVNGAMSFFAMYPPIFRDRRRAALNLASLDEVAWMLRRGGVFVGIHPEGTRNKGADAYSLLPAQSGVGRILHGSRATVLPVFINGPLQENLPRQIVSNFDGTGVPIHMVFGEPVPLDDLYDAKPSPRTFKRIAERTLESIAALGEEERALRAETERSGRASPSA